MFLIARKTFLAKNLKKMQKMFPEDYDFFPKTWILPNELNDLQYFFQSYLLKNISESPSPKSPGRKDSLGPGY